MKSVKNIIFDFDGTLADTSKLIVDTMQKTIEELDLPPRSENEIKATIGIRLEEIPSYLWPDVPDLKEKVAKAYRKNFEIIKGKVTIDLFPGVLETIKNLKDQGINLAIATSRSHRSVEELSKQLGIKNYFDYILGGDNVEKGKPDPQSIFKILDESGWRKEDTMMVGDMSVDILMGKNAGIKSCGVTYGNGMEGELRESGADFIIDSFNHLTLGRQQ